MGKSIEHKGTVLFVEGDRIDVEIIAESACAGCHVKKACGMGEQQEKVLQLLTESAKYYDAGEEVIVYMEERKGIKAAVYAYMVPFFVIIATLLVTTEIGLSELAVGLISLGSLVVYYTGLWFFRKKIEKEMIFKLRKIETE